MCECISLYNAKPQHQCMMTHCPLPPSVVVYSMMVHTTVCLSGHCLSLHFPLAARPMCPIRIYSVCLNQQPPPALTSSTQYSTAEANSDGDCYGMVVRQVSAYDLLHTPGLLVVDALIPGGPADRAGLIVVGLFSCGEDTLD